MELDSTKGKKSNTPQNEIVGHISIIGQFTSTVPAPQKHQQIQTTTTQPKSRRYWKARKQPSQQPYRNYEKLADQLAPPYEQEHPAPEPLPSVHQHPRLVHPRDPYRLHHHSQQHHNRLQVLHHLTHQQPEPWLNRTNPEFWEQPQNHTTVPLTRLWTFGIPSPIITPLMPAFTPPTPRRSHRPLPTLR